MLTNVYIAAPIQYKSHARKLASYIEEHCPHLHVCSVWHDLPDTETMPIGDSREGLSSGHLRRMAVMDLAQLNGATAFIYLAFEKSGGASAEFGYAIARNLLTVVVGKFLSIFQMLDSVKFIECDPIDIVQEAKKEAETLNGISEKIAEEDE